MYFRVNTGNKSFWVKNEINALCDKKVEIKKNVYLFYRSELLLISNSSLLGKKSTTSKLKASAILHKCSKL